ETNCNKVVENAKAAVASACQIKDLNVLFDVHLSQRDFPETRFFTPRVDTPAATALKMLETDDSKLTQVRRMDWARLIVSFGVRTPEALRDMGPKEAKKAFEVAKAMAEGDQGAERRVTALVGQNMRPFQRTIATQATAQYNV